MRKRNRHLKPKSLGMRAAYDSRYISGLSDGAVVSTWSDLSGNSFNATQATAGRQPIYKTSILGGAPTVRFDGAGDNLLQSITHSGTCCLIMGMSVVASQTGTRTLFSMTTSGALGDTVMMLRTTTTGQWGTYTTTDKPSNTIVPAATPTILTMNDNAASGGSFFYKGDADGTWTGNSISQGTVNHIGGYYTTSPAIDQTSNVDIGVFYVLSSFLLSPLLKRVQQSIGYSFKIACS